MIAIILSLKIRIYANGYYVILFRVCSDEVIERIETVQQFRMDDKSFDLLIFVYFFRAIREFAYEASGLSCKMLVRLF